MERETMNPAVGSRRLHAMVGAVLGVLVCTSVLLPWITIEWRDASFVLHLRTLSGLELMSSGWQSTVVASPVVVLAFGIAAIAVAPLGKRWFSVAPHTAAAFASALNLLLFGGGTAYEATVRPDLGLYLPIPLGMAWIAFVGLENRKELARKIVAFHSDRTAGP